VLQDIRIPGHVNFSGDSQRRGVAVFSPQNTVVLSLSASQDIPILPDIALKENVPQHTNDLKLLVCHTKKTNSNRISMSVYHLDRQKNESAAEKCNSDAYVTVQSPKKEWENNEVFI
jgi:hypothetical protein